MKIIRIFKIRVFVLAAALSAGFGFVSPAFAQYYYSIIINPDGKMTYLGRDNFAEDINDAGQVTGYSSLTGSPHAFITGPNGVGRTDLGTLPGMRTSYAYGINDAGQVVGYSYDFSSSGSGSLYPYRHAFITGPNGAKMADLGTLGGTFSEAYGINDAGRAVGYSMTEDGQEHAFITGPNGVGMTDIGTLGGTYSNAYGINATGQVMGVSTTADERGHVFITGPNGVGMTALDWQGTPTGINDAGQIAGYYFTGEVDKYGDRFTHAFITGPDGVGMTDIGTLGGPFSRALGINDAGQVVGYSTRGELDAAGYDTAHAFITGPNGMEMTDLHSLLDLPVRDIAKIAYSVNNLGQVIAVVSPIPEPASYALMLAGLGLVGFMARSRKAAENNARSG